MHVRPYPVEMNSFELKFYLFMISSNKCTGSFNVLSRQLCFPNQTKDTNFEVFIMITNRDEGQTNKHVFVRIISI